MGSDGGEVACRGLADSTLGSELLGEVILAVDFALPLIELPPLYGDLHRQGANGIVKKVIKSIKQG